MQEEPLTLQGLGLLVVCSLFSLIGMKFLHSSRSVIRFREEPVPADPLWSAGSVLAALAAFLLIPAVFMVVLDEAWDTGLYSSEGGLRVSSVTGGLVLGGGLIILSIWRYVVINLRQSPATLGFCGSPLKNLPSVILFYLLFLFPCALVSSLYATLLRFLGHEASPQAVVQVFMEALGRGNQLELALMFFNAVVLAPLVEEVIFRGFLFGLCRRQWGAGPALVVSSLVFAAFHTSVDAFLPLTIVGLALGYVYHRTRSLYCAMFFHVLFNLATLVTLSYRLLNIEE